MKDESKYLCANLEEYLKFITLLNKANDVLILLLSSKTIQDTVETIKVFRILH